MSQSAAVRVMHHASASLRDTFNFPTQLALEDHVYITTLICMGCCINPSEEIDEPAAPDPYEELDNVPNI